jgi:hypothetical protein
VFPVGLTGLDYLSLVVLLVLAVLVFLARRPLAEPSPASLAFLDDLADLDRPHLGAGGMVPTVTALVEAGQSEGLMADLSALLAEVSPAAERRSADPAALAVFPWLTDEAFGEAARPPVAPAVMTVARLVLVLLLLMALLYRLAQG